MLQRLFLGSVALGLAATSAIPETNLVRLYERGTPTQLSPRQACSPDDQKCWPGVDSKGNPVSISTDSEVDWPQNGPVSSVTLTVTQATASPDGNPKNMLLVNNQYPGPTINANWGDTLVITVINNMVDNGTSIHWHGITQQDSSVSDGANGVTECPIPGNGGSRVYTFKATQHGTSWYHSHYSSQYGDGIVGAIQINGPASENYAIDLGPLTLTDYYCGSIYQVGYPYVHGGVGGDPTPCNYLINGTHKNSAGGGKYNPTTLTPGKRHRLRLINTSVNAGLFVSLDAHTLQVIAADFVPIKSYNTTWLFLAIGQRYDVIIDAPATPPSNGNGNYWFRVKVASGCGAAATGITDNLSIFNYAGTTFADPTSTATGAAPSNCLDEKTLVPYNNKTVPKFTYSAPDQLLPLARGVRTSGGLTQWTINSTAMNVDWEKPTLGYIANGSFTGPWLKELNILPIPDTADWTYWIITSGGAHPIHLHGHDFYVLGAGTGTFTQATADTLNYDNPTRRDVAMVQGWLAIAFQTNNPGAWLMHCHIAWHVSEGLAIQFLEKPSQIGGRMDLTKINGQCNDWDAWYDKSPYKKDDSGL